MPAMAALLRRFLSASEPQPCVSGRVLKTSGTKLEAQYRRSYALFKLLFSFFDGIGPVDQFGCNRKRIQQERFPERVWKQNDWAANMCAGVN